MGNNFSLAPTPLYAFIQCALGALSILNTRYIIYTPSRLIYNQLPRWLSSLILGSETCNLIASSEAKKTDEDYIYIDRAMNPSGNILMIYSILYIVRISMNNSIMLRGMGLLESIGGGLGVALFNSLKPILWRRKMTVVKSFLHHNNNPENQQPQLESEILVSPTRRWASIILFTIGLIMSPAYEIPRKLWLLKHPGEFYSGGLTSIIRHPNYLSDCILGLGWDLMTTSNWLWLEIPFLDFSGFYFDIIPSIQGHLSQTFGSTYANYLQQVKWNMIPGIY